MILQNIKWWSLCAACASKLRWFQWCDCQLCHVTGIRLQGNFVLFISTSCFFPTVDWAKNPECYRYGALRKLHGAVYEEDPNGALKLRQATQIPHTSPYTYLTQYTNTSSMLNLVRLRRQCTTYSPHRLSRPQGKCTGPV